MNINESVRALVTQGLRNKKESRAWLAEKIGVHKSWATRFFSGELKSLTDEQAERLQFALDIRFNNFHSPGDLSTAAKDFATEFDRNPAFATVAQALMHSMSTVIYTPRYVPTQDMAKLGNEIIRVATENKDKPGKVARLILEMLA